MIPPVNRRDVTRWMLSAAISSLPATKLAASSAEPDFNPIRRLIHQAIASGEATGVAVAVVHSGHIVWEEGFGWANREAGLKTTPHTPFSMASITKPFTATTLMTLVAEGRLSLDNPANQYLAASKLVSTNSSADAATVRLLGAHASGLPGMYEAYDASEAKLAPTPTTLLQTCGRLAYPPATCYEYSNIGFAALNAIAYGLTQTDFSALMQQRLLAPLGLQDSFFGNDLSRLPASASRYDAHGRLLPHYTTSTPASGELHASAHDLARFALFNLRHRLEGRAPILNDHFLDQLHRPVFTGPSGVATTFGWFKGHTPSGIPFFFKSGGDPGVATRMYFIPSKDLACVVITNRSNGADLTSSVCNAVLANCVTDWHPPIEDCSPPDTPFVATPPFRGQWQGSLQGGGATMPVQLHIESGESATLALGTNRAEAITKMRAQGEALLGLSTGQINSPDAIRAGATTLQLKLLPYNHQLTGRVLAIAGDPNIKSVSLPFVLTLHRSQSS